MDQKTAERLAELRAMRGRLDEVYDDAVWFAAMRHVDTNAFIQATRVMEQQVADAIVELEQQEAA